LVGKKGRAKKRRLDELVLNEEGKERREGKKRYYLPWGKRKKRRIAGFFLAHQRKKGAKERPDPAEAAGEKEGEEG